MTKHVFAALLVLWGTSLGFAQEPTISVLADPAVPPVPENDLCPDAIGPLAVPSLTPGSTIGATNDDAVPDCGTVIDTPGVWYTVVGAGSMMTATTCENQAFPGSADYDSKISVFCGDCGDPLCVAGNDDEPECSYHSTVTWCSQAGVEYLILVHGFAGATGDFELAISEDDPPCVADVQCLLQGACCLLSAQCLITTEDDCLDQGGAYQGDDTDCGNGGGGGGDSCGPGAGDCCFPDGNGTPGCNDEDCCASVCGNDPFCCDVTWDGLCALAALDDPNCNCDGGDSGGGGNSCGPGAGDCCDPAGNGTPGCDDAVCCESVCGNDPFCCDVTWDSVCAGAALANPDCNCDGTGGTGADDCADAEEIFEGETFFDTTNATTDGPAHPACQFDGQTYFDVWYFYTATCTADLTVSTCGQADYDTDLVVYDGCDCASLSLLGCNDDATGCAGFTSEVTVGVVEGGCYLIRIGSWNEATNPGTGTVTLSLDCGSLGACCRPGGSCIITTEACCEYAGGSFLGVGTDCGTLSHVQGTGGAWEDISVTGTQLLLGDDDGAFVPIGFGFTYWGDTHPQVAIASNGYLTFSPDDLNDFSEDPIPDMNLPNNIIAVLWDDLDPGNPGSPATIHYQTLGTAPNRRFIAQWTDLPEFPNEGASTFQAALFEGTNCIELRYQTFTTGDFVAGIENQDGTAGVDVTASVAEGVSIELCPQQTESPCALFAELDIKPGSCPNPLNRNSHGVLPVALMSTDDMDVQEVDIATVRLSRADGVGAEVAPNEGPPGPHSTFSDVATPFDNKGCMCDDAGGDGVVDLSMKFKTDLVVQMLELDDLPAGALVELVVTGQLLDGTSFVSATDCIRLVPPGTGSGLLAVRSDTPGVWVDVSPLDNALDGGGFADFERFFPQGTVATLEAEASMDGIPFHAWEIDGVMQEQHQATIEITIDENVTVRAVYYQPWGTRPTFDMGSNPTTGRRSPLSERTE